VFCYVLYVYEHTLLCCSVCMHVSVCALLAMDCLCASMRQPLWGHMTSHLHVVDHVSRDFHVSKLRRDLFNFFYNKTSFNLKICNKMLTTLIYEFYI